MTNDTDANPMDGGREALEKKVAAAIDAADTGYSIRLTGLDGSNATYTLDLGDGHLPTFPNVDDARDHALQVRAIARARAAITALSQPAPAAADAGLRDRIRAVLAEWFDHAEGMCRAYEGDLPDKAEIYVVAARRSRLYLGTYGELRRAALAASLAGAGSVEGELLGRFDHHPDPAIDFCVEVEVIEGLLYDRIVGASAGEGLAERIAKAMTFRVGGDEIAVRAKGTLRKMEAELAALTAPPAAAETVGEDSGLVKCIADLSSQLADAKGAAALNLAQLKQWRKRAEAAETALAATRQSAQAETDIINHYRLRAERAEQHVESLRAALTEARANNVRTEGC